MRVVSGNRWRTYTEPQGEELRQEEEWEQRLTLIDLNDVEGTGIEVYQYRLRGLLD